MLAELPKRPLASMDAQSRLELRLARQVPACKRPDWYFAGIERLRTLDRRYPVAIVLVGKAHPRDDPGTTAVRGLHAKKWTLTPDASVAFEPDYKLDAAQRIVAGVDLWLNTPLPPLEASGTSGMKAELNGVPSLSVLDGWWLEGHIEGVTGWAIGDGTARASSEEAASLYDKLEEIILPLYFGNREGWITVMKGAIAKCGAFFTSHRMMRRYAVDAYLH
jgi:starch phosphorylase